MATVVGHEGNVVWLVAVLLLLAVGLAGAVLAATRPEPQAVRMNPRRESRDRR